MVGVFRWLICLLSAQAWAGQSGQSLESQGDGKLPMTAMLAWAKANNENVVACGTGDDKFPWPVREGQTPADFPMENIGFDAIAVLELVCRVFNVWSEEPVDMSTVNVCQAMNIPESTVNRRKCDIYDLLHHGKLASTPFFQDDAIMQLPMVTRDSVPDGEYQWFPFSKPTDDRIAAALDACIHGTSLDLNGMWQDADGQFVLLFEYLKPARAGKYKPKPVKSNIELYCFRVNGSVEGDSFSPCRAMLRQPVGWAEQQEFGFHIGHFMVLHGLYATSAGLQQP